MNLKNIFRYLKSVISVKLNLYFLYARASYSQEGEDLIIQKIVNFKKKGFYVDIGAHHPFRYSNTFLLYKNGWRGINIDADIKAIKLFKKARPKDINVAKVISNKNTILNLYVFNDTALNTLSRKQAGIVVKSKQSELVKILKVKSYTLEQILTRYLPKNASIDFLNLDVEGLDYEVLRSNNWNLFKPKVICIEILLNPLKNNLNGNRITKFLLKKGYVIRSHTINSFIFDLVR
ncbi:MAG: SAM-dependent methyltransferase [Candidatus Woesebacteria bacterium GW2011_GWB1_39_12]|uniref:SAM-dependent methyltransferase n=2 Tax=Candidatus Woeseibacteriota TaxID=1752722 RepID=A0A0G0M387_9BACT|nr:MAG: SAM-dependent methyltransferase [Candidatus Woesebacteria bacterium GW2011_GWA1_39_12]KKR00467.1 MAG: SAM-dependent methyltransferase [Candidatus Woesebacteria bacterium GW2011_GWB1_39_12]